MLVHVGKVDMLGMGFDKQDDDRKALEHGLVYELVFVFQLVYG